MEPRRTILEHLPCICIFFLRQTFMSNLLNNRACWSRIDKSNLYFYRNFHDRTWVFFTLESNSFKNSPTTEKTECLEMIKNMNQSLFLWVSYEVRFHFSTRGTSICWNFAWNSGSWCWGSPGYPDALSKTFFEFWSSIVSGMSSQIRKRFKCPLTNAYSSGVLP